MSKITLTLEQNKIGEWLVCFSDNHVENFGLFEDAKLNALEYIYHNCISTLRKEVFLEFIK